MPRRDRDPLRRDRRRACGRTASGSPAASWCPPTSSSSASASPRRRTGSTAAGSSCATAWSATRRSARRRARRVRGRRPGPLAERAVRRGDAGRALDQRRRAGAAAARNLLAPRPADDATAYAPVPFFWSDQVRTGSSSSAAAATTTTSCRWSSAARRGPVRRPVRPARSPARRARGQRAAAGDAVPRPAGRRRDLGRSAGAGP